MTYSIVRVLLAENFRVKKKEEEDNLKKKHSNKIGKIE